MATIDSDIKFVRREIAHECVNPDCGEVIERIIAEVARLRSAAILAARLLPDDIRKVRDWFRIERHETRLNPSEDSKVYWTFYLRSDGSDVHASGPTDADALDSIRHQLNLPIPGETTPVLTESMIEKAKADAEEMRNLFGWDKPLGSLADPCSHPDRGGQHETYLSDGKTFCRACGAGERLPIPGETQ